MKLIIFLSAVCLTSFFIGCSSYFKIELNLIEPSCDVTNFSEHDGSSINFAKVDITVKNKGYDKAYSIGCDIILTKNDTVVDESYADFGDLATGESLKKEFWLNYVTKHSQYDSMEIILTWYDEDGTFFKKSF